MRRTILLVDDNLKEYDEIINLSKTELEILKLFIIILNRLM